MMRGQHCGRWTMRGIAMNGRETVYRSMKCKCWNCKHCGPKLANRYRHAIRETAEQLKLHRFLTLTLDPKRLTEKQIEKPVPYLRECWNKFRTYLRRKYGEAPKYIAVLEFQKNGLPHLHVLVDRFIDQKWIKETWQLLGGGMHVDIRCVDLHRVSHYLSKYLTKELLMSAPKKTRRVTVARGIHLREKPEKKHFWEVLGGNIFVWFSRNLSTAKAIEFDEDGVLFGFKLQIA